MRQAMLKNIEQINRINAQLGKDPIKVEVDIKTDKKE
jgi:hypothetical protein